MKKITLLFILIPFCINVKSQVLNPDTLETGKKFFIGLSYSYLDVDMKLLSMTKSSIWNNQDLGTKEVSQEDIDTINSYMDYNEKINNIGLSAGMVLLNKTASKWYIDGRIFIGMVYRKNTLRNRDKESQNNDIRSEHYTPSFGLGFDFKYFIADHWGVDLSLNSLFSSGKNTKIDENIYPAVAFMEENKENRFLMSYSASKLMGIYTAGNLTIEAGPGFYFFHNRNEYNIVRESAVNSANYEDTIETTLRSDMFIMGCLQVSWKAADHFLINAGAGISKDITINAGIFYSL